MKIPALSFVGESGSGKTTLLRKVVSLLVRKGYRVGVIKHSSGFEDPDRKGKDSELLRKAGAQRLLLASKEKSVLFDSHPKQEPDFQERAKLFRGFDILLVESWKSAKLPAVLVSKSFRPSPQSVVNMIEKKFLTQRKSKSKKARSR